MVLDMLSFVLDDVVIRLLDHRRWVLSIALGLLAAYHFHQTSSHCVNPAKNKMNVDRCVQLHNDIVRLGWEALGRNTPVEPTTWFERHGEGAKSVISSLSDDLVAFLKQAHEVDEGRSFFYYVNGLNYPGGLFEFYKISPLRTSPTRYVQLYVANNIASHPVGLIFDQVTNTAIMCVSMHDVAILFNGRTRWYPLETVLEDWLDMIYKGKVKALLDSEYSPWIVAPYSETILQETAQVFNKLVEAIESRLPGTEVQNEEDKIGLLDSTPAEMGFLTNFVRRCRRPRFRYIAPGLQVQTDNTITGQPFFSIPASHPHRTEIIPPFLLFRSFEQYSHPSSAEHPFAWPYSEISLFPAGLYFLPIDIEDNNRWDDQCLLVLPFGIGANGFARMSDGTRFGENIEDRGEVRPKNTFIDIYQTEHQPFIEMHKVRLVHVLKSWLGMVERGDWEVDQNGIVGGIEKWREVDTESGWEKYIVPVGW